MTGTKFENLTDEERAKKRGVSDRVYRAARIVATAAAAAGSPMGPEQAEAVAGDLCAWLHEMTGDELRDGCSAAWREHQAGGRTYGYPGAGSIASFVRASKNDQRAAEGGGESAFKRAKDCSHKCRAGVVTMLCPDGYEVAVVCDCAGGGARRIQQPGAWGPSKGVSSRLKEGWGYLRDDPDKEPVSASMADWVKAEVAKGCGVREAARRWREWQAEKGEAKAESAGWMR